MSSQLTVTCAGMTFLVPTFQVVLLLGCLLSSRFGYAEHSERTKDLALRSLSSEMEELYSTRFGLNTQGIPTVTIGLMDGQRRISFTPQHKMEGIVYHQGHPKRVALQPGRRYTITLQEGQSADIRYALVAFSLRSKQWAHWPTQARLWQQRGFKIKSLETGSIFAVRGKLFDNRRRIGIIAYEDRAFRARLRASQISERYQTSVHIHTELLTRPSGKLSLSGAGSRWLSQDLIEIRANTGDGVQVERVEFGRGYSWHRWINRTYRGSLLFTVDQNGQLALINRVLLPDYLAGLLAAEMPLSAPAEALKAQSVCARNEILAKIGTRHLADPYLFCAHTHCQVYTGIHPAHQQISGILSATRGEVMLNAEGHLADASYSAVCGGHSEHNEHVWGDHPRSALRGKLDTSSTNASYPQGITEQNIRQWLQFPPEAYCRASTHMSAKKFRWSTYLRASQVRGQIQRLYPIGDIQDIIVRKRGVSGRVYLLQIVGTTANTMVRGELRIRRLFGNLNSSMFVVEPVRDSSQRILGWRFTGGGWGHGVGMCQHGAIGRAQAGWTYQQILRHYFSQISLVKLYP